MLRASSDVHRADSWSEKYRPMFLSLSLEYGRTAGSLDDVSYDWKLGRTNLCREARQVVDPDYGYAVSAIQFREGWEVVPGLRFFDLRTSVEVPGRSEEPLCLIVGATSSVEACGRSKLLCRSSTAKL